MDKFDIITKNLAIKDVTELENTKEKFMRQTKIGSFVGHYAGGEYFFFQNGKELFRSQSKELTIKWLTNIYR